MWRSQSFMLYVGSSSALDFPQIGSPLLNVAYLFHAHQSSKKTCDTKSGPCGNLWKPVEPTWAPSSINNRLLRLALDFPQIGSPPLNVALLSCLLMSQMPTDPLKEQVGQVRSSLVKLGQVSSNAVLWKPVESCGGLWKPVEACGSLWRLVEACGSLWKLVEACGSLWEPVAAGGGQGRSS
jgi:hypothetical protein